MARKIVITSGKGGVGKTSVCANLGISLAKTGKKICLIDLDIGLNNLDVALGVENKVIFDIVDVANGKCRVSQALIEHNFFKNLYILPSNQSFARHNITTEKLSQIISVLDASFDFVLIDCPAGIEDGFYRAVSLASEALVVASSHIYSIRDADKVLRILTTLPINKIGLILNRIKANHVSCGDSISPSCASALLRCPLIGVIYETEILNNGTIVNSFKERGWFDEMANNLNNNLTFEERFVKKSGIFNFFKKRGKKID